MIAHYKANAWGEFEQPTVIRGQEKSTDECSICLDLLVNNKQYACVVINVGSCEHEFHHWCIAQWLKSRLFEAACPVCRYDLTELKSIMQSFNPDLQMPITLGAKDALDAESRLQQHNVQPIECASTECASTDRTPEPLESQACSYDLETAVQLDEYVSFARSVTAPEGRRARPAIKAPNMVMKVAGAEGNLPKEIKVVKARANDIDNDAGAVYHPDMLDLHAGPIQVQIVDNDIGQGEPMRRVNQSKALKIAKQVKVYVVKVGCKAGRTLLLFISAAHKSPVSVPLPLYVGHQ